MKKAFLFNIPLSVCNLRCHYCYLTTRASQYEGIIPDMAYSPRQVAYAMRKERVGGEAYVNLCADGETLLLPKIEEYAGALASEGHWIEIVSNMMATKRLDRVLELDRDLLKRIEFKCSLHYLQLRDRGLLDLFSKNVTRAREAGASINVEITPSDELIPHIDEVKDYCMREFGALAHLTIARNDGSQQIDRLISLSLDDYNATWSTFDSSFWEYKSTIFGVKQTGFCNAGSWSYYVNMSTGKMRQCYCGRSVGNLFDDPDAPLPDKPIGRCSLPHCYNGHVFLTLGTIAGATEIGYGDIRDRRCSDGSHWLQPELKEAFNTKLESSNREHSKLKQAVSIAKSTAYERAKKARSALLGNNS